jgi:hypothetical protein
MAIAPKTREQIAYEYGLSPRTFARRLSSAGIRFSHRRLLLPNEQKLVYETLGWPVGVSKELYSEVKINLD